ncbi:hypothetical protein [Maribacter flavus]|uniref:Uncharacterized protein n=1 Tax=Maribacter flavus TaxID=1658664 RepID=A0A5B2TMJ9_9FLAO|nr:hypothetical protein [Maribacter flavus]KAA2215741.1 hypothetical protein F0361_16225 [Maribacter flavus]
MDKQIKISEEYKKGFNLGYSMARELDLKSPIFESGAPIPNSLIPHHDGVVQYLYEQNLIKELSASNSVSTRKMHSKENESNKGMSL